jgi:DeoR/GlpR family transcriptional regulator of sugar metabolism
MTGNWFQARRQEFILATLKQFGQVRRQDIMREFDVSLPQASSDIQTFLAAQPALVRYDVSAKAYTIIEEAP